MRTMVQSFSIGIITATLIIGITYIIGNEETGNSGNDLTQEQAEEFLNNEGFAVVKSSQYEEVISDKEQLENEVEQLNEQLTEFKNQEEQVNEDNEIDEEPTDNERENEESNQEDSNQSNENETASFILVIQSGMTSIDIANELEREQIIDHANEFNDFLEENNYSRQIQLGEYQLNDRMNYDEIAEVITN